MKKLLLLLLFVSLSACKNNKKYTYIEIIEDENFLGSTDIIEKDTFLIKAENDSIAFLEAYKKFIISKKVENDYILSNKKFYDKILDFKLLDNKNIDISKTTAFKNINAEKLKIEKEIFGMENIFKDDLSVADTKPNIIDSTKIKVLKHLFNHKTDEFSEDKTTWITPKASPTYRNQNGIYCYFGTVNKRPIIFRFVFQYHKDDWLFINKCQFLIDDKPYEYTPNDLKRDNDRTGITEWFDDKVDYSNISIVQALANAKKAKVKLIGDQYHDIKTFTPVQLQSIKRTYEYYKALGGEFK